jgi:dihydroorotate dehydrogenase/Pyruvate/2-oxoacid:ferredoxin oxidoreductase delta subunit
MADLSVTFVGKKLRSPLGVASHAVLNPGLGDTKAETEHLKQYADLSVGYIHTPFICPEEEHPRDKPPAWKFQNVRSRAPFAMEGLLVTTEAARIMCRLNPGLNMIEQLRENLSDDVAVIANMIGPGADPEGWADHCKKAENAGADIIEMNVSCPIPASEAKSVHAYQCGEMCDAAGCLLGDSPALLIPVVKAVVDRVNIPVGVKLTPETGFPRVIGIAEEIQKAGAKFITGINAPITCGPPDIYKGGRGKWVGLSANPICAALGPWDRFLLYRNLGVISAFVPGIEQAGVGGLVEPEHIVEAMMLGARICEYSSGLLWKGTPIIEEALKFLSDYMDRMGYTGVEDFIGLGVKYIQPVEDLDWRSEDFIATVDDSLCTKCGRCANSICSARRIETDALKLVIDSRYCIGCGLCRAICPENAVSMVEQKHPVIGVSMEG